MIGTVTPSRLAFVTDQCVTSQLKRENAPGDPAIVRYPIGSHAAGVVGIACDSPIATLTTRHTPAPTAVPTAFSGITSCFGDSFSSTFASAAALAPQNTVSSPASGTETPSSPAKITATPAIATIAAMSLRATRRSTPNSAARIAVVNGTDANRTAAMPLGTVVSPLYRSAKFTPRLKKPHSAAPRRAAPRGNGIP